MTEEARRLLRRMLKETGLSQHEFARLVGRAENTINSHANQGVIPMTFTEWLLQVQEIRTQPGYAVIVVGMPSTTPVGEYRRAISKT